MQLSLVFLAVGTALAVSLPNPINARALSSFSGENGLYNVVTARDGTHMATFTPFEELNAVIEERDVTVARAADTSPALEKRLDWVIYCQAPSQLNANDVLAAQAGLRASVGDFGTFFTAQHWAFVRHNSVIAYFCSYSSSANGFLVLPSDINTYEVQIDNGCGWPSAGYDYRIATTSFSVGRRAYGGEICTSGFTGW